MDASVFVRQPNATEYAKLGVKTFSALPRVDEFISADSDGKKKFYQIIAVHHTTGKGETTEIYGVQTEPTWQVKKSRAIGFSS